MNEQHRATSTRRQDRQRRRPVQLRGFVVLGAGETIEATVLDLTYDGCCIQLAGALDAGQSLSLSVPGLGVIEAEVRWCDDGKVGLAFLPDQPQAESELTPRAAERIIADAEVMQRRPGQPSYRVRIFDLSRHGCKAEFVERPRVGDHVWIKFEGLESLDAEVCWADGFQAGLKYVNPIHPAVFELLTKQLSLAQ